MGHLFHFLIVSALWVTYSFSFITKITKHCSKGISSSSACIRGSSSTLFASLIDKFDASGVRMYRPENEAKFDSEGSSLVATRCFAEGEVLCSIPFGMCIMSHSSGAVRGGAMIGQQDIVWECAGDLRESVGEEEYAQGRTWDINLAIALLDATCGEGLAGDFWESYTGAYPRPESITVPFCLPKEQLLAFRPDDTVIEGALRQKERLGRLFPALQDPQSHRMTAHWPHLSPLAWAFAMVRSRCFRLGNLDFFAVVPIIELANHALQGDRHSNVRFEVENVVVDSSGVPTGVCILRAKRRIQVDEPVQLSYDEGQDQGYSNRRLITQYGFCIPANIVRDEGDPYIPWAGARDILVVTQATLDVTVDALVDSVVAYRENKGDPMTHRILSPYEDIDACASTEIGERLRETAKITTDEGAATAGVTEVLRALQADVADALECLGSSIEEDSALLNSVPEQDTFKVQYKAALRYRMQRKAPAVAAKMLIELALEIRG